MTAPTIGRIVHAVVEPTTNNSSDVAPATVVRVWDEHPDGGWVVNLKVHLDSSTSAVWFTSVRLVDDADTARQLGPRAGAFWPPRSS